MKETFILYTSYKDAIMVLSDEQAGRLLKAIFEYATTGIKQEIDDTAVKFAYMLIVSQIESSNKQYEKKNFYNHVARIIVCTKSMGS